MRRPAGAINPLAPLAYRLANAASGLRQLSAARAIGKVRSSSRRFGCAPCSKAFCMASPDALSTYVAISAAWYKDLRSCLALALYSL